MTQRPVLLPQWPDQVRFWKNVEIGDCWEWQGSGDAPYGLFGYQGTTFAVHRVAWVILTGDSLPSKVLDHLCRNTRCVNPDHLEPVSAKENVLRGEGFTAQNSRKTHCPRGHEYTPENIKPRKDGGRDCRACHAVTRNRARDNRAKHRRSPA